MFVPKDAQAAALKASVGHYGFGFFMEQGLGKTGTTLQDFLDHSLDFDLTRMVVIAPNSFKAGWAAEVEKFSFPITPLVYESGDDRYIRSAMRRGFNSRPALIVNYESLRSLATRDLIRDFVRDRRCYIAADESIKLKDPSSDQTKAALEIAKEFLFARVLSGKPIAQGPHDLWAQMRFIKQLNGFKFYPFRNAFCRMGGFKMKTVMGAQNEEILAERIDPHIFRATKAEWTDLPNKMWTTRDYTMSPEQKRMYKQMEDDFVLYVSEFTENDLDDPVIVDQAITKYIKLAQIQAGFVLNDGKYIELVAPEKNARLNALEEFINEGSGKHIVVYNHKVVRDHLYRRFEKLRPVHISGGMTPAEIEGNKAVFNTDPRCRVIFITKAAKYGHTLIGQEDPEHHCSTMAFYENTYSLDDRSQLEDRNHRYGSIGLDHGNVGAGNLYSDITGTPLDRAATRALQRKESVFRAVFDHIGKRN